MGSDDAGGEYLVRTGHPWRGAFPRKTKLHEVWALLRWPYYARLLRRNCDWRRIGWALWEHTETAGKPQSEERYHLPGPRVVMGVDDRGLWWRYRERGDG